MFANDSEGASSSFTEALDLYRSHGDRRGEAWALQNLAWVAYTNGDAGKAEVWLNESVQAFTEIRDSGGLGWATGLLAFVRYHQGRHGEAEAMAQRMYVEASQRGDRWAEGMMRTCSPCSACGVAAPRSRCPTAKPRTSCSWRCATGTAR